MNHRDQNKWKQWLFSASSNKTDIQLAHCSAFPVKINGSQRRMLFRLCKTSYVNRIKQSKWRIFYSWHQLNTSYETTCWFALNASELYCLWVHNASETCKEKNIILTLCVRWAQTSGCYTCTSSRRRVYYLAWKNLTPTGKKPWTGGEWVWMEKCGRRERAREFIQQQRQRQCSSSSTLYWKRHHLQKP